MKERLEQTNTSRLDCRKVEKSVSFRWNWFFRSRDAHRICQD